MFKCFVFTSTIFLAPRINRKKEKINKYINLFIQKRNRKIKQLLNLCILLFVKNMYQRQTFVKA